MAGETVCESHVPEFTIKDSGARQEFDSGMVRDTDEGKTNFLSVRIGPMYRRWAEHLTKGRVKYPDAKPGVPNWTLAYGEAELNRARESAARHFEAWLNGEKDEDHAAGVYFNINLAEYVEENRFGDEPDPVRAEGNHTPQQPSEREGTPRWPGVEHDWQSTLGWNGASDTERRYTPTEPLYTPNGVPDGWCVSRTPKGWRVRRR